MSHSLLVGSHLASLEGGVLADDDDAAHALLDAATSFARSNRVSYIIIRGGSATRGGREVTLARPIVSLMDGIEGAWDARGQDRRREARRARDAGVVVDENWARLDEWYAMYSRRMRDLGTPVEGFEFFDAMRKSMGKDFHLVVVTISGRVAGGALVISTNYTWAYLYGVTERGDAPVSAALFWSMIERASQAGAEILDLGASAAGTGADVFKRRWADRTRGPACRGCL